MKHEKRISNTIYLLVFSLGVLIAVALVGASALAEYEAVLFDSGARADERLSMLYCPALISSRETSGVSISLSNPSEYEVNPVVKARISSGSALFIREEVQQVFMKPGERQTLRWPITAEDAAYHRLILVRIMVNRSYPLSSRTATCGIVLLDFAGLTGIQMQVGAILLSAIAIIGGGLGWFRINADKGGRKAELGNGLRLLGGIALAGTLTTFTSWWFASLLCAIACLLLGVILLGRYGADVDQV